MAAEDPRLVRLTQICLALPEVVGEVKGAHAAFAVRKKKFAYFLNDHHGDGIVGVACKVLPGDNDALVQAHPSRFYRPAYLASSGWVALRVDREKVDWREVAELVTTSYRLLAPKTLTRRLPAE
jgi:phosphoribosylglycinamide formyltransferase-1